jgi:hypothetical protein
MKSITYNFHIFKTWVKYILLGKKISKEGIKFIENNYSLTKRQKKLLETIKIKNK